MKILILSTKLPWPAKDGGAIATLNLAKGLAANGCQVTLLAMNTLKHYFPPGEIPPELKERIDIRTVTIDTRIRPVQLIFNLFFSSLPYIARRFRSSVFSRELASCLSTEVFDIIQLEGPYLFGYIHLLRKYSQAKIALRAHNLEHRIWQQTAKQAGEPIIRFYRRNMAQRILRLEQIILDQTDLLVPISKEDTKGFRDLGAKNPLHVCPAGLDTAAFTEEKAPSGLKLFYIGALDWGPNQEGLDWFFREIWPSLLEKWPEIHLNVAGRNHRYYFDRRTVPINVSVTGEVNDAADFFRQHNTLIVPLLSGSGLRIKILEAMAMGRVVISTATGVSGLGAIHGKHLFIADTPSGFIEAVRLLEDEPELIGILGRNARNFVKENFDNLAVTKNLMSFYKEQLR